MMPSSLAALIVAWSMIVSPDAAPVPPAPKPAFSVLVLRPNFNAEQNRYDSVVCGNFVNVPTQLQVKIVVRRTDPAKPKTPTVSPASVCVQTSTRVAPAPACQDFALTAYHRIVTSLVGATFPEYRTGGTLDDPLMYGVEGLAHFCHRADADSLVANVYTSIVQAFGKPQQDGMMRDVITPSTGQFLGFAFIPAANAANHRTHVRVEFWSGPKRLATYKNADGEEWLPVPW